MKTVSGFSKLSRDERIQWLKEAHGIEWDTSYPSLFDDLSENVVGIYSLPYSVVPNVNVNGVIRTVPMVTEESSVVAAAASAAKFWMNRGGFASHVRRTEKVGHIHLRWKGPFQELRTLVEDRQSEWKHAVDPLVSKMEKRGGGILGVRVVDHQGRLPELAEIVVTFNTVDAMGANFINSVLETMARFFVEQAPERFECVMAIVSNDVPDCRVSVGVSCPVDDIGTRLAERMVLATEIARVNRARAVTHNKGIMNGVDAILLATGNDTRAVAASVHAYAARDGEVKALSRAWIHGLTFYMSLDLPLPLGTVGGISGVHPMVKRSLDLLGRPSASELMMIVGAMGLASNFSALRALVTIGIQSGHMKLHLSNMAREYGATPEEMQRLQNHFENESISHTAVAEFLQSLRGPQGS